MKKSDVAIALGIVLPILASKRKEKGGSRLIEDSYHYYDMWRTRYGIAESKWDDWTKPKDIIRFFINRLKEIEKDIREGKGDDYQLREEHGHISSYLQRIAFHLVDTDASGREWMNARTFRDYQLATIRYVLGLLNHSPSNGDKLHADHKSAVMDLVEINALGFITDNGDVPDTQLVLESDKKDISPISENYRFKYMNVEPMEHQNFGYLSGFLKAEYLPIFENVVSRIPNMKHLYDFEIGEAHDLHGLKGISVVNIYIRKNPKYRGLYLTGSFMSDMVQLFRLVFEPNMMNKPNTQVIPYLKERLRL